MDKYTDAGLIEYAFYQDSKAKLENDKSMYFDSVSDIPITNVGTYDPQKAMGVRNTRWITFNIPAIDALARSNPFVKKAVNYLSSKPLINGIDINTPRNQLSSDEVFDVQETLKSLYVSLKDVLSKGHTYGGAAGLLWFSDQTGKEALKKPLDISKIKKNTFQGIKPLARWFQVEPALDKKLIEEVGGDTGFRDARMIGMPMYYNVNLSGGMAGQVDRTDFLIHSSRLLIFNAEVPSFIETQIERYWGPSIVELAWNELAKDSRLWNATTKSAEKNNMGVLKIHGLGLAGTANSNAKNMINTRIGLIKEGSSYNVLPVDSKDDFDFVNSVLTGQKDIIELSNSRLAGSFKVPVSVLFPTVNGDQIDSSYIQSLSELQDIQMRIVRVWYDILLQVIVKSVIGRKLDKFMYSFNPIETQVLTEKAKMAKVNAETTKILYDVGFIDQSSGIKMIDDIAKDPQYLSQNINIKFREEAIKRAESGGFVTANSDKIELAEHLNQLKRDGEGLSGVENPESGMLGKQEGGNPNNKKNVFNRNELNPDKSKKG